jgi:DNA mismatch endonuclease (patch repair protein)
MGRIKGRDTTPERAVRRTLHRLGYRFRLHAAELPGRPDLSFPSRKKAIFVHGCYWHGHSCKYGRAQSKTNRAFWREKLRRTRLRDTRVARLLRRRGWQVLTIWECAVKRANWQPRAMRFLDKPSHLPGTGTTIPILQKSDSIYRVAGSSRLRRRPAI